jgi:hypothetical protein
MHMADKKTDKMGRVRTTVTFDPDVAKILERLQRERGVGLSDVVNDAVRDADAPPRTGKPKRFVQTTSDMGIPRMPMDNIGEVLDIVDQEYWAKKLR